MLKICLLQTVYATQTTSFYTMVCSYFVSFISFKSWLYASLLTPFMTPPIKENCLFFFQHDVDDNDYYTNGAGYHHSHKYGFGLLDSWRLVNTAKV